MQDERPGGLGKHLMDGPTGADLCFSGLCTQQPGRQDDLSGYCQTTSVLLSQCFKQTDRQTNKHYVPAVHRGSIDDAK